MEDIIYSDWMIGLLLHLGLQAPKENKYRTLQSIYSLFELDDSAGKLASGGKRKGNLGWPHDFFTRSGKPQDEFCKAIREALNTVGKYYGGPLMMAREARSYLLYERGVEISELTVAAGISESRKKRVHPCLPERWEDCPQDSEEWKAFCNIFVKRCVQVRSDSIKKDGLLCLPLAVLANTAAEAERDNGTRINYVPDSFGCVAANLPETDVDLLDILLPKSALGYLGEQIGMTEPVDDQLIDQLVHSKNAEWLCRQLSKYFSEDGGSRYSSMISNAREVLPIGHDFELFRNRLLKLFEQLKDTSMKPPLIAQTWSEIQVHAKGDGARLLSGFVLSLIMGPESSELLTLTLQGIWGDWNG